MNLHINKISAKEYQAVLKHPSGIEIFGPSEDMFTPIAAVDALAEMVRAWTEEIPATLPEHKSWLTIAAALKARVALSENRQSELNENESGPSKGA